MFIVLNNLYPYFRLHIYLLVDHKDILNARIQLKRYHAWLFCNLRITVGTYKLNR